MGILDSVVNSALGSLTNSNSNATSMSLNGINFPVLPSSISMSAKQNNSTVNINNYGEFSMLGKQALRTITVSSFFPANQYDFCVCAISGAPNKYVSQVQALMTAGTICQFSLAGTPLEMTCTVESFSYGYKDGTDDIDFTMTLKEYRYVEGTAPKELNKKLGINKRPTSFLQKVAQNINYYPGDNPMDCISRAVGKSAGQTAACVPYLQAYQSIAKGGKLSVGSVLNMAAGKIKLNGITIPKAKRYKTMWIMGKTVKEEIKDGSDTDV